MGAADVYMLGHSRIGEAIHRAGLFAAGDIPFMLQNVGGNITRARTCHMMAAFPSANFHFFSDCETWSADVVYECPEPTNGFLRVSEGPGLGVTLNRTELERLSSLELPDSRSGSSSRASRTERGCTTSPIHRSRFSWCDPIGGA